MKILYFTGYFFPEKYSSSTNALDLLERLSQDNDVSVITPQSCRGLKKEEYKKYIKYEEKGKIKINRFRSSYEKKGTISRYLRYFFCNRKYKKYKQLLKESDIYLCISTPPILGKTVGKLAKKYGKKCIYDLQDIFPDSLVATGLLKKKEGVIWRYGRHIERITYNLFDKIVVLSSDMKNNLIEKGVSNNKIEIINNAVNTDMICHINKNDNSLFDELSLDRKQDYIVYAGNFGKAQNIDVILDAAKKMQSEKKYNFVLIGEGVEEERLKKRVGIENITNVHFYPYQNHEKISNVYSLGIASIVTCERGTGGMAMPSKVLSILSTGTPIIACFDKDTELERIVVENNLGLFCQANDIEELCRCIKSIYDNDTFTKTYGQNARNYAINNISVKIRYQKYLELLLKETNDI